MIKRIITLFFTVWLGASAFALDKPLPEDDPGPAPNLGTSQASLICVSCENQSFDNETHKKILSGLLTNKYNNELRKALFWQDKTYYQFESKAHFDNCDFEGGTSFIQSLIKEVDTLASKLEKIGINGNDEFALDAFFKIGQALHAIQDFYAHTNYIEMKSESVSSCRIPDDHMVA